MLCLSSPVCMYWYVCPCVCLSMYVPSSLYCVYLYSVSVCGSTTCIPVCFCVPTCAYKYLYVRLHVYLLVCLFVSLYCVCQRVCLCVCVRV